MFKKIFCFVPEAKVVMLRKGEGKCHEVDWATSFGEKFGKTGVLGRHSGKKIRVRVAKRHLVKKQKKKTKTKTKQKNG